MVETLNNFDFVEQPLTIISSGLNGSNHRFNLIMEIQQFA
jgi:hypothetical protein